MNVDILKSQLEAACARMEQIAQSADNIAPVAPVVDDALQELSNVIEELRVAAEEVRELSDILAEERSRYSAFADFTPDGYLVTDEHGKITEANRAACDLFNVGPEVLVGKPLIGFVASNHYKPFLHHLGALKRGTTNLLEDASLWLRPVNANPVSVLVTAAPVRKFTGEVVGARWLLRLVKVAAQNDTASEQNSAPSGSLSSVDETFDAGAEWIIKAIEGENTAGWRAFLSAAEGQHKRLKHGQAERLYKRAVDNLQAILPPADPAVAICLFYQGDFYKHQGRHEEAEEALKEAIRICMALHGCSHPYLAISMHSLADVYCRQGRHAEAVNLLKSARRILESAPV